MTKPNTVQYLCTYSLYYTYSLPLFEMSPIEILLCSNFYPLSINSENTFIFSKFSDGNRYVIWAKRCWSYCGRDWRCLLVKGWLTKAICWPISRHTEPWWIKTCYRLYRKVKDTRFCRLKERRFCLYLVLSVEDDCTTGFIGQMILRYRLYKSHTLFLVITLTFVVHFYLLFSHHNDASISRLDNLGKINIFV